MNNNFDKLSENNKENINKKIDSLSYKFLEKYTKNKETIKKLMSFETSKWLEIFKKQLDLLKSQWIIEKKVKTKDLFLSIKEAKEKISIISKNKIETLKKSLNNKEFIPNSDYDLAEKIKNKNPKLYKTITNPKNIKEHFISAWYWIWNSIYKTLAWLKTLWIDFLKLLSFQVPIKQIKEQFKKV